MLDINIEFHKGILFVRLDGVLDYSTVNKLESSVTNLSKESGIINIVFNVSNLKSIDYYGINELFNNYKICSLNNGKSLLCGINNDLVKQTINKSRLKKYMYETLNELTACNIINL